MKLLLAAVIAVASLQTPEPPAFVVASGVLTSVGYDAKQMEGYYAVGEFTIVVHPRSITNDILKERLGKTVKIVITVETPREPGVIVR